MKPLKILLLTGAIALTLNIYSISNRICNNLSEKNVQFSSMHCESHPVIAQKEDSQDFKINQDSGMTSKDVQKESQKNSKEQKQPSKKSFKKFIPSEKIDVDTVVDFPIDI